MAIDVIGNPAPVDSAAGVAGLRTLGPGAQQAAAGNHTHSDLGVSLGAYKSSTTSRSSTTTMTNDPHLTLVLPTAGTWLVDLIIEVALDNGGAGWKHQLAFTGTATTNLMVRQSPGFDAAGVTLLNTPTTVSSGALPLLYSGGLVASTTGTLSLQWAQAVSNVNATMLGSGSVLRAMRIA